MYSVFELIKVSDTTWAKKFQLAASLEGVSRLFASSDQNQHLILSNHVKIPFSAYPSEFFFCAHASNRFQQQHEILPTVAHRLSRSDALCFGQQC